MKILRTEVANKALEKTVSRERLTKYLTATGNNLDAALSLYEHNTQLSEALYTPLQSLEICFRNSLHERMSQAYGSDWLTNGTAPLNATAKAAIEDALRKLRQPIPGDIVAELKFSFWVSLLGTGYDDTLWRKIIYKGFLTGGGKKRSFVHGRFNAIRRFRNRVAHHEPIFDSAMQMHDEIIEAIGWMCAHTQAWTAHLSRFNAVQNARLSRQDSTHNSGT